MTFSTRSRYLLITAAILTASVIQLMRGYKWIIVLVGAVAFLAMGYLIVYLSGSKERERQRQRRRDYWAGNLLLLLVFSGAAQHMHAQLQTEPPLPAKQKDDKKKQKGHPADLEWMWQYSPSTSPPLPEGREHELIQDPSYHDFLNQYFTAPQTFWGSTTLDPRNTKRKSLADTVDDFLTVPGKVLADDNRYITITGHVFRFPPGRGLVFADLNTPKPLVVFAAIDWIRESHATTEPDAEYTLWIFVNQMPGTPQNPYHLPAPLVRSLARWMAEPLAGSGIVQKITAAILVDPDGTPHQIPVPTREAVEPESSRPPLTKRSSH